MFKTWSNLDLVPAKQFIFWREMLCDAFTDLRPETTLDQSHFEGNICSQSLSEGVIISSLSSQKQKIHRTESDISHAKEHYLFFNLQKRGFGCIQQNNMITHVKAGDLYILDTRYPYEIEQFENNWESLSLRIPLEHALNCMIPLSKIIDNINSADNFILYENILSLEKVIGKNLSNKTSSIITKTTIDLMRSNFKNLNEKENILFNNILRFIEHNAKNHNLRCSDIAKAFNTSERNIYKVFEKEQLSLNQTISDIRLKIFFEYMKDHQGNITDFVYKSGFNDLSNFYKIFKHKFNETPKKYFKNLKL
ncbi:helix-turn-helix domain-containing protein [Acinetobacter sichuanensis]|uniref:helix-turn-helix domain-containing protein n=1 Tax=Acinetobacter sichuanensis TaxID=2136183 RepID=UPI00281005B9|nr:helix-turn-helix domain-containing protein [Acinetobacter sichuanensis]MDQ9019946.1 helix-turn-helix domain-containing protein [Acinetobacter sichuanensis]